MRGQCCWPGSALCFSGGRWQCSPYGRRLGRRRGRSDGSMAASSTLDSLDERRSADARGHSILSDANAPWPHRSMVGRGDDSGRRTTTTRRSRSGVQNLCFYSKALTHTSRATVTPDSSLPRADQLPHSPIISSRLTSAEVPTTPTTPITTHVRLHKPAAHSSGWPPLHPIHTPG